MRGHLLYLSGVSASVCNSEIELSLPGGTLGDLSVNRRRKMGLSQMMWLPFLRQADKRTMQ